MDCGNDSAAPDPRIGEAALKNSEIAQEALDWYKGYYQNTLAPLQQQAAATNERVTNQAMDIAGKNAAIAQDTYNYQRGTFRPVEQAIAADAMSYDTAAQRERRVGVAQGDVLAAYDAAQGDQMREMQRLGIDPSSGRTAAILAQMGTSKAGALAAASNKARESADAVGWARKVDAAGIGRNLSNQQATAAQIALSGGNSASNAAGATAAGARADAGVVGQGFNTAIQGNQSAGNLYTGAAQIASQAAGRENELLGTVIGTAGRYAIGKWG